MNVYFDEDDYAAQCDDWEERERINAEIAKEDERESRTVFMCECRADKKGSDRGSFVDGLLEWESEGEFDDDDDDLIFD